MLRKSTIGTMCFAFVAILISSPHTTTPIGAQEDTTPKKTAPTPKSTTLIAAAAPTTPQSVFAIICDSKPNQIIILDSSGKWLSTVRQVSIDIEMGKPSTIVCTMWSGQFKPTNVGPKTWGLSQIQAVSATQFQSYIDKLQTDPMAIAKENTK